MRVVHLVDLSPCVLYSYPTQSEYTARSYQEVISPNMFNSKLWETSGHWQNYKDDMFTLDVEKEKWGLKPMNCPGGWFDLSCVFMGTSFSLSIYPSHLGHCLIFDSRDRSYKELPIRMAEFGIIHRCVFVLFSDLFPFLFGLRSLKFDLVLFDLVTSTSPPFLLMSFRSPATPWN